MGLPFLLLAYVLGLGCAPFLNLPPLATATPFLAAALWLAARRRRKNGLLLLTFFFTLGISLYHLQTVPPRDPGHIRAFVSDQPLAVEGTVLSVTARPGGRSGIDLEARLVASEGIAAPVRGRLRLYVGEGPPQVRPGDAIRFLSRLRAPRSFGTPGEFDFPRHLAGRSIFVTAFIPRAKGIANLGPQPVTGPGMLAEQRRTAIAALIDESVSPPTLAPLVRALVVGDKGGIDPAQRELLARAGISHLFSISGLHLGLIAVFLYSGGRFLYRRSDSLLRLGPPRRYLPPLLLPLLWAYLLLSGGALPTFRAFLMTLAGALLFLGARRSPPLKLLAAAAFVILCLEPLALFEPSFQLSFAGVLGILVLLPRWRPLLTAMPRPLRWLATLMTATLAATIATLPFVLYHFHLITPAGLLTNLVAVPAIGFIAVPLGLCGAVFSPFWPTAAEALFQGCGVAIRSVLAVVDGVVSLPLLGGWYVYASPLETLAVFLLAGTLLLPGGSPARRTNRGALLALTALLFLWRPAAGGLEVTALSVGQGESMLISDREDRHYLVDGGGLYSETFDVGERLLAPALGRLGVPPLEAVILSHDHPDHRKGLLYVLEYFPVRSFWSPLPPAELHPSLRRVIDRKKIPVVLFPPGWTVLEETEETKLALFVPRPEHRSLNDRSLVLYAREGTDGVLLTGDLETAGVSELLAAAPPEPVTLLKLPHHGSRHSSPERLLERFEPSLAFASVGVGNPHGLPHPSVIEALAQRDIPLYRTDRHGTLRFTTDGSGWRMQRWQTGLFR